MRTLVLPGEHAEVYSHLAPFAMSRTVVRELGGPVFTSPSHRWVFAFDDTHEGSPLLGWAGVDLSRDGVAALDWNYVLPEYRRAGVFGVLNRERFAIGAGRVLVASTSRPFLKSWYLRQGFTETRQNGAWTHFRREP